MTDEQMNVAISEACGWEEITESVAPEEFQRRASGMLRDKHNNRTPHKQIPDYCTDLNAMHEAEKTLNIIEQGHYWDHLKDLTDEGFDQLHATARHRAEAFLRTVGKWEEVQP